MKYLLLFHLTQLQPDLANRCHNLSFDDIFIECIRWNTGLKSKHSGTVKNKITCNFCVHRGHKEEECRKKMKSKAKTLNESSTEKKILSVDDNLEKLAYQLGTAADFHVSANKCDFSSYSKSSQTVRVAGGGQVTMAGCGDLLFPTVDNKTIIINGAIHLPGQKYKILSTAQLEKQGYSIRWPSKYRNTELIHPNGSIYATFQRIGGRLIYKPSLHNSVEINVHSATRNWHQILGHPGQKAQEIILHATGIKGDKYPIDCETCTKTKITKFKGKGSLRTASSFREAIHMDLVGGQKTLAPTTTDDSVPNATLFLLAIDEFTLWKWAWPIYSKKTVPTQIQYLLEHLKTKFSITPKRIHTDSGTEFANSILQQILNSRGIEWHRSSSHAPEQNGIAERNVRTVTEKICALHLQSGLPPRIWPIILSSSINILNITPNSVA